MKIPMHVRVIVCDAHPFADYARVTLRIAANPDAASSFSLCAQRNPLRYAGGIITQREYLLWESERIEKDTFRNSWDVVPGFGSPYGLSLEASMDAVTSATFAAFFRAIRGRYDKTPSDVLTALRADRRLSVTIDWTATLGGHDYSSVYDVPPERKGGFNAFLRSPEVLRAKADQLIEQAERESARRAELAHVDP